MAVIGNNSLIVLCDDDQEVLVALERLLVPVGFTVAAFDNALEVLRLIVRQTPRLVITGINMPLMSGYDLRSRLRKSYTLSELPIVAITGRLQEGSNVDYSGFNRVVQKPLKAPVLLEIVQHLGA